MRGLALCIVLIASMLVLVQAPASQAQPALADFQLLAGQTPGRPAGALAAEILADSWYRAYGATATVTLPALDAKTYTSRYAVSGNSRVISYFLGKPEKFTASAVLIFFEPAATAEFKASGKDLGAKAHAMLEAEMLKSLAYLKADGDAKLAQQDAGHCTWRDYAGAGKAGAEKARLLVVADGEAAAAIMVRGLAGDWAKMAEAVLVPVLKSLRVGGKVPRLADRKPGLALSGVWLGRYRLSYDMYGNSNGTQDWMTFDPRGYLHEGSPDSERDLDVEARFQWNPKSVATYDVRDGKLIVQWPSRPKPDESELELGDGVLWVAGDTYRRVDGHYGELRFSGRWESSDFYQSGYGDNRFTFSSHNNWYFTAGGRFSNKSGASAHSYDDWGNPDPADGYKGWVSTYSESITPGGRYSVVGNRLRLKHDSGEQLARTVFAGAGAGFGILYIGGGNFLFDDNSDPLPRPPAMKQPATAQDEWYEPGYAPFIRARGASAIVRLDKLYPSDGWEAARVDRGVAQVYSFRRTPKAGANADRVIALTLFPRGSFDKQGLTDAQIASQLLSGSMGAFLKSAVNFKAGQAGEGAENGMRIATQPVSGVDDQKVAWTGRMTALSRDRQALVVFWLAPEKAAASFERETITKMLKGLQLGDAVTGLDPRGAEPSLEGIYVGPVIDGRRDFTQTRWLVFDKRGYVSPFAPGALADLELIEQREPGELGRFDVKDKLLEINWPNGHAAERLRLETAEGGLLLDGRLFLRVDIRKPEIVGPWVSRPEQWRARRPDVKPAFRNARYWFGEDGTFSCRAADDEAQGPERAWPPLASFKTWHEDEPAKSTQGRWKLEGNRLYLMWSDGRCHAHSVYAEPTGERALIIDGATYLPGQ